MPDIGFIVRMEAFKFTTAGAITAEERRARQNDQSMRIRFRMMIGRELEERGITKPAEISEALGMSPAEATKLLTRHQWREGDLLLLEGVAARWRLNPRGP